MASNYNNAAPSWMADVKEDTTKTSEWNELSKHIFDAVEQHLSQSHVTNFAGLQEAEKSLLLERAARSLASSDGGRVYENLQSKLSYLLDQTVNNQVAKKMLEDNKLDTKTDLVLDTTSEGVITLLRKHPEQKYKLRVFLNQSVPQPVRFMAWQLFFSNNDFRKKFIAKLTMDPKMCLSPSDAEIQRKCEIILNSTKSFKDIKYSMGSLNSIKGILSYYHATMRNKRTLSDSEYLYAVPIVYSHHPPMPPNERPSEKSMSMLIEIYLQFIQTLPAAISQANIGHTDNPEMEALLKEIIGILNSYDKPLIENMRNLLDKTGAKGIEDITFNTGFKTVCTPMIKNLFAGYLSLEPLMYIWDQYVISSDVPDYHTEFLPIICAIILMILRDQLNNTVTIAEFEDVVKSQALHIQTRQIQAILNKYFFKKLQDKMNSSNKFGPVIDPTAGRLQKWEHWHQDIVPHRTLRNNGPNEAENGRIQAEIDKRLLAEKAAQQEIERLRRELERVRHQAPKTVVVTQKRSPSPFLGKPISRQPVLDILNKLKLSVEKIKNGNGTANYTELNLQTQEDLRLHKLDLKMAEREIFGRQLTLHDWEVMSDEDKVARSAKILQIVKSRLQKRHLETGKF